MQNVRLLARRLPTTGSFTSLRHNKCSWTSTSPALFCAPHRLPFSTAAIPSPNIEGEEKNYAPKIHKLVDEISKLTLLEVADLNELLKKSLNIADTPMMMPTFGGMGSPAKVQEVEEEAPKVEKTLFTVRLIKFDDAKKVALIKEVKNHVAGMNLVQAKKYVESLPQTVATDISKEEAEKLKTALSAVGATVEVE